MTTAAADRPRGWRLLRRALASPVSASMLAYGFTSGLPFALLIGTLNAWLGEAKIDLKTIGVLSWIGLAYAFKFLWSPIVDRGSLPAIGRLGRRKGWIVAMQATLVAVMLALAATDPAADIGRFALIAVMGAIASATQDIAIDAWRIDVADEANPVELLAALQQFGYRSAGIIGGAFALFLAARLSWPDVFVAMAALLAAVSGAALVAPDRRRTPGGQVGALAGDEPPARLRRGALALVALCWAGAIVAIGRFMVSVLAPATPGMPPSAADFLKHQGPWIVVATVLVPLAIAAAVARAARTGRAAASGTRTSLADHLYTALVAPLVDLVGRLGWGVLVVIGLILTYALCYNVWATFAYPFYLDYMHYSKDEVAFASKIFGIVMSMLGVGLGGVLFLRLGRFPTVMLGVTLPILGNFLYADLADGAPTIDAVLHATRLDLVAAWAGSDLRMARLLLTICYENISTGLAGAAFIAYVSTIVSKRFPAVQYALLSSLTFLIGSLGRGVAGEAIDQHGYATVFRWVALAGLVAIGFVIAEWVRATRAESRGEPGDTGLPA